jgi:hypothetical protein
MDIGPMSPSVPTLIFAIFQLRANVDPRTLSTYHQIALLLSQMPEKEPESFTLNKLVLQHGTSTAILRLNTLQSTTLCLTSKNNCVV